jgi:ATP-dependent protease ClpP protease subunit
MPKDTINLEENIVRFRTEAPKSRLAQGFEVKALSETAVELFLYGEIGWDVTAKEIIEGLRPHSVAGNKIVIWANSPGGDVTEGYAIGNWIKASPAEVEVRVDGLAASMASYIAAVADRTVMPRNSMQMIHRPWGVVVGTAEDMDRRSGVLAKMQEIILAAYEEKQLRTLGSVPEGAESLRELMWNGEYLSADDCFALGLCDEISDAITLSACIRPDIADRFAGKVDAALLVSEDETAAQDETPPVPTEEELAAQAAAAEAEATAAADAAAKAEADRLAKEAAIDAAAQANIEAAQAEADIRAVCRSADAEDRAAEFISAKASLKDVRKALWKAAAARDAEISTDPTPPAPQIAQEDAYAKRAADARQNYAAALTR